MSTLIYPHRQCANLHIRCSHALIRKLLIFPYTQYVLPLITIHIVLTFISKKGIEATDTNKINDDNEPTKYTYL